MCLIPRDYKHSFVKALYIIYVYFNYQSPIPPSLVNTSNSEMAIILNHIQDISKRKHSFLLSMLRRAFPKSISLEMHATITIRTYPGAYAEPLGAGL